MSAVVGFQQRRFPAWFPAITWKSVQSCTSRRGCNRCLRNCCFTQPYECTYLHTY